MLVFARVGAMVMLMPGFGESNIPVRIKLVDRAAADADHPAAAPRRLSGRHDLDERRCGVLMVHEIVIGIVLGATARVTLSALPVAGSVIAQQLGLGFVTAVDPTQGQQGVLIGNFLTILGMTLLFATDSHHLVIAALNESYRIFSPGEMMSSGDVAALATQGVRRRLQDRHAAFGAVSGVRPRLQYRPWRAGAADAGRCRSISSACRCRS